MDPYVIPGLRLPFSTATHPQSARVQELTERWCRSFDLLRSPTTAAKFHALGYGRLMSTLCPNTSLTALNLVTDWNSFFFIVDDQQNNAVTTNRRELYEDLVASMRKVITEAPHGMFRGCHPLIDALRDLLHRTVPGRSPYWTARFRQNLDLWLRGHLREDSYRMSGTIPAIEDYISVRRAASTVLPTLDLVEMIEGATVPEALYRTHQYQNLILGTADIMCWVNDIHSLHIEKDDPINFVKVLAHHGNLKIQDAINAVAARISGCADDHLAAARGLPATMDKLGLNDDSQGAVMRCVRDHQSWAAGMESWDRTDTIRFATNEIPEHGRTAFYVDDLLANRANSNSAHSPR